MTRYYHATPKSNFNSIVEKGIISRFDGVYCSTSEETAARWICFTRRDAEQIMVLPFDRPEGDERMTIGIDHSPMMTEMLGVPDEGASYVYGDTVNPRQIVFDDIRIVDNVFYNRKVKEMMQGEE